MKKSRSIKLVLLGSAGLALAGCEDSGPPQEAQFFSSIEQCAQVKDMASCEAQFNEGQMIAATEAPRYSRKEQCEAEYGAGNCEQRGSSTTGSFFMPMLMGYMVGQAFNRPVYRGPNGSAVMNTNNRTFQVGSFAGAGRTAGFQQQAQATEVRRGGFGTTASARGATSSGS